MRGTYYMFRDPPIQLICPEHLVLCIRSPSPTLSLRPSSPTAHAQLCHLLRTPQILSTRGRWTPWGTVIKQERSWSILWFRISDDNGWGLWTISLFVIFYHLSLMQARKACVREGISRRQTAAAARLLHSVSIRSSPVQWRAVVKCPFSTCWNIPLVFNKTVASRPWGRGRKRIDDIRVYVGRQNKYIVVHVNYQVLTWLAIVVFCSVNPTIHHPFYIPTGFKATPSVSIMLSHSGYFKHTFFCSHNTSSVEYWSVEHRKLNWNRKRSTG